ncbi:MAG: PAS domain S-box protein [Chloroflexota bacterium]
MSTLDKTSSLGEIPSSSPSNKNSIAAKVDLKRELFGGFWGELFDSMPEGVYVANLVGESLYINKKFHELWKTPVDMQGGDELWAIILDKVENPSQFQTRIAEILSDINCESQDTIQLKSHKIYHRSTKPLVIDGKNVGRLWTFRDITKEYQTEQALRDSEKNYKQLYDRAEKTNQKLNLIDKIRNSANDNSELPILIENLIEGLAETFGYDLLGFYTYKNKILNLVHVIGYDYNIMPQLTLEQGIVGRTAKQQKPIFVENVSKDPAYITSSDNVVSEIAVPVFDRNNLFGILNIESEFKKLTKSDFHFISALCEQVSGIISRVSLYTEVKTQEQQLQRVFDFSPIGVIICALDGTFIDTNPAFQKTIGYTNDELREMKFKDITHPEEVENNLSWTRRLVEGEISEYSFEKRYIHKNGSFINAYLKVSIMPTRTSEPDQLIAQVLDFTNLKKAESALMEHQKLESIGVLAGGIAHDFNNLLVAMKAQSSLALLKLPPNSPAHQHIEKANHAADSAAQLTSQLLAYSGQGQFKIEQTDLNDEVEQNSQLLTVAIPKNVEISSHLEEDLPKIMVDQSQLQQILMNLIINGAEAMNGNAGHITITTTQTLLDSDTLNSACFILTPPAPGSFVEISIADDGMGMSTETLAKIFDPFFTTKFTGRGLGLAAVLGIVRSHNGGLIVDSKHGQGTKFSIFFPVAANQSEASKVEKTVAMQNQDTPETGHTVFDQASAILLIDDDKLVREAMTDLFELEDIPLLCAADGKAGIEVFKKHASQISLILLDLSMPGISSEDTFTELRRLESNVPIVLCSGYSESKVNKFFADKDHSGFVAKPFNIKDLIQKINEII